MATAANTRSGLPTTLSQIIARHVCHCPSVPCVFANIFAVGGISSAGVRCFSNPPPGDLTTDSYEPGHGLKVFFKARDYTMRLTDDMRGPYFNCNAGPIEITVFCPCSDHTPHEWMFDTFCVKYNWYVTNVLMTVL